MPKEGYIRTEVVDVKLLRENNCFIVSNDVSDLRLVHSSVEHLAQAYCLIRNSFFRTYNCQ